MQFGAGAWLLEQAKGYIVGFVVAALTIGPLALLGVIDRQWLVLPAALGITSAFVVPLIWFHRWWVARVSGHQPRRGVGRDDGGDDGDGLSERAATRR